MTAAKAKANLQEVLQRQAEASGLRRRIEKLSEGLIFALDIKPYERGLVIWLAPQTSTNREAIEAWVGSQLEEVDNSGENPAVALRRRLVLCLNKVREVDA